MDSPQEERRNELATVAREAAETVLGRQRDSEDRVKAMVVAAAKEAATEAATEAASKVAIESAQLAATKAVTDTLTTLGLDPKDRDRIVRNFIFLDDIRGMWNSVVKNVILAVVGIITTGVVSAVWFAVKAAK